MPSQRIKIGVTNRATKWGSNAIFWRRVYKQNTPVKELFDVNRR
jgi:hypothetical protein